MKIIVYPVSLFPLKTYEEKIKEKEDGLEFCYVEDPVYFTKYKMNKKKIILHRASMKKHQKEVKRKYKTRYIDEKNVKSFYSKVKKNEKIWLFDPNDLDIDEKLKKIKNIEICASPGFFLTREEALEYSKGKKSLVNSAFYKMMRQKTGLLMNKNGKSPIGGKWSFDENNRKKIPKGTKIPDILCEKKNDSEVKEAIQYVNKNYSSHNGDTENFIYPTDRQSALSWLKNFMDKRGKQFGPYQDYICQEDYFLFHSVMSSSINTGLLVPQEVCEKMVAQYKKKKIKIDSCEGFIRQILSWREYVRLIYLRKGKEKPNLFKQKKKISKKFYTGETGIEILDQEIKKAVETGYSHHIVRLMVFGNIFTLLGINPEEMHKWFMEVFIDSYQWVMWANVYGMGSYADDGYTMKRPYISSANYLKNMSDYPKGEWEDMMDNLYYYFLGNHEKKLKKIYATSSQVARYKKYAPSKKKEIKKEAENIIKKIF
jgi:deoxyribodipyrimidine photolyase-related protein